MIQIPPMPKIPTTQQTHGVILYALPNSQLTTQNSSNLKNPHPFIANMIHSQLKTHFTLPKSNKMQKRINQILTSLKEHTCSSYAKIATIGGLCDINLTILKATSPDDIPLNDKYVHELLKIFSISPCSIRVFALSFSRRFGKTRAWRVALKCLLLLHRLLQALPNPDSFRAELLWARTNGAFSLDPCNFQDFSSSASDDYTAFIRSYARLLDEALDCSTSITEEKWIHMHPYLGKEDHNQDEDKLEARMREVGRMIEVLPQIQSLMDRVIDCRPIGAASRSFLVQTAMKHITRESLLCYTAFRREIVVVLENLIQLPYRTCVAAFGIYKKAAHQADCLSEFLEWSKAMGYCGSYEYPFVDRIPQIQIRALETFLNGMWQLTDQSSSTGSTVHSPMSLTLTEEDNGGKGGGEMEAALIEWEEKIDNVGWEELLEASISSDSGKASRYHRQVFDGEHSLDGFQTTNPFYQQPCRIVLCHGSCPATPIHAWDI